jgi:hypothetical protein
MCTLSPIPGTVKPEKPADEGEHLAAVGQFDRILETVGLINHDAATTG